MSAKLVLGGLGWTVKGYVDDWEWLAAKVKEMGWLTFGYYGDIWLEWDNGEYCVRNTVTGAELYRGKSVKEAFFRAKMAGKRYDDLDDKYFHNKWKKAMLRGY